MIPERIKHALSHKIMMVEELAAKIDEALRDVAFRLRVEEDDLNHFR